MLKRYPYWGWLLLSLLLWAIAGYRSYSHRQARMPERMARIVTNDLRIRERELSGLLNSKKLLSRLFTDSLTEDDESRLMKLPVYIFAYNSDTLVYWNNNFVIGGYATGQQKDTLIQNDRGIFLAKYYNLSFIDSQKTLTVLIPVVTLYPIQNDYLHSHFEAADYIPIGTQVLDKPVAGSMAIKYKNGTAAYYLKFNSQDMQHGIPDALLISMLLLAVLFSIFWLQLIAIHISRERSPKTGLAVTLSVIIVGRMLIYMYGLPFRLDELPLFSPRLYASSAALSSLGDVLINTLCLLWIVVFIVRHTPYKKTFTKVYSRTGKYLLSGALAASLVGYAFGFVYVIRTLVIDSSISFDVSHFYSIDIYTIVGLFTIGVLTIVSCIVIYLLSVLLSNLIKYKWSRYVLLAVAGCLFVLLSKPDDRAFFTFLVAWLILYVALLDVKQLKLVSDLFAPHMLFWALFICAFGTVVLQYFNHVKDGESRKVFATQGIAPDRDDVTEYAFDKIAASIRKDKALRNFLNKPVAASRKVVNDHIDALLNQLSKYQDRIYIFDRYGHGLYNKDTAGYNTLSTEIEESTATVSSSLFYREYILEGHHYLAYIPVSNDSTQKNMGSVFIDLSLKQATNEAVYPELLQAAGTKNENEPEYPYAIYVNNHLVTQTHNYPFPVYINPDTSQQQVIFYDKYNASELWYKLNDRKTVIVVHRHNWTIEAVTLFSYLFGVQIMIAVLILLYQLYLSNFTSDATSGKLITLTLRRRVHFSMLGVVLVSFLVIGVVTIVYFKIEYKDSNENKLQRAVQVAQQSVQQYLIQEKAFMNEQRFDSVTRSNSFKYHIADLAAEQKIDINVYNNNGVLNVTSQDDIFDKGLLSRIIRSDAYYQLIYLGKSIVTQDERIGKLFYLSCYVPLRDEQGTSLGYLNVPFFSSEKDLNYQISNIVVTLINLYAFIFLISSLFTVFITRWITRSLNIIIGQFGRLNLQRNELLEWRYDDEIGMLVQEYNKMVRKVEENAALLAQNERESAWREMARQVAHEIKNPLTPMKLNIQYLQQALRDGHPNAQELAMKVSASLVEQIENLSYIASEFSSFAKMPEARPENINLVGLLDKLLELYMNDAHIKMSLGTKEDTLMVFADRSQLLRVFTNLLENAKQAIPEDRMGDVEVMVHKNGDNVVVSITDNGIGIPSAIIEKIFQPYFTTKSSGTGLGLAMTRKIIEFWDGHIWFETKENEGTTFFISLPLVKE